MVFKKHPEVVISTDNFDFKELFDANYPMVFRHLMLIMGERAAAEDLAQETFIKLYEKPPKEFTNLTGWLIRVSTNLAYNYLRGEKNRKKRESVGEPAGESFEEDFLRSSEALEARRALELLDEKHRTCLILKFSGFSYDEIAGITGINKKSVGKTLARAQEKFRRVYERKREHVL